jgi:hypothetical protein
MSSSSGSATTPFNPYRAPSFASRPTKFSYKAVLWIRIGFNADPDPDRYLNTDPDTGSQTNADHGPLLDFKVTRS